MRKGNGPARRRVTLIAAAAAVAVAISAAAALAAPGKAAPVSRAAPAAHPAPAAPAARAALLAALRQEKPVQIGGPDAYIDGAFLCLTYSLGNCLALSGNESSWWVDLQPPNHVQELWNVFKNAQNYVTFESYYNSGGSGPNPHLCMAADHPGGQVYLTSNCFGNPFASWYMSTDSGGGNIFYNAYLLHVEHVYQALSVLNLRTGAFVYVEPVDGGPPSWQNWKFLCPAGGCL